MLDYDISGGTASRNNPLAAEIEKNRAVLKPNRGELRGANVESREASPKILSMDLSALNQKQINERLVSLQSKLFQLDNLMQSDGHTLFRDVKLLRFDSKRNFEINANVYQECVEKRHEILRRVWSRVLSEKLYKGTTEEFIKFERTLPGRTNLYEIVINNKENICFDGERYQAAIRRAEEYTSKEVSQALNGIKFWKKLCEYEGNIKQRKEIRISVLKDRSEALQSEVRKIIDHLGGTVISDGLLGLA